MSSNTENIPNTFQNFTFRVVAYRLVILVWDGKRFNKSNTMYEEVDLSCNYLASNWPREQNSPRFDPIRQYLETLVFKYSRSLRDRFKRLQKVARSCHGQEKPLLLSLQQLLQGGSALRARKHPDEVAYPPSANHIAGYRVSQQLNRNMIVSHHFSCCTSSHWGLMRRFDD